MTSKDARTPASAQIRAEAASAHEPSTVPSAPPGKGPADGPTHGPSDTGTGKSIGWHKAYVAGSRPDLRVPVRQVHLTNGKSVTLYDTSGPYTDENASIDLERGLPPRAGIVSDKGTQLQRARNGEITAEMAFIAEREGVGISDTAIYDESGPIGRACQTLLVGQRRGP